MRPVFRHHLDRGRPALMHDVGSAQRPPPKIIIPIETRMIFVVFERVAGRAPTPTPLAPLWGYLIWWPPMIRKVNESHEKDRNVRFLQDLNPGQNMLGLRLGITCAYDNGGAKAKALQLPSEDRHGKLRRVVQRSHHEHGMGLLVVRHGDTAKQDQETDGHDCWYLFTHRYMNSTTGLDLCVRVDHISHLPRQ